MSDFGGEGVVVIGGGFDGLSVTCYLADAGADVDLVEKKRGSAGGRASSNATASGSTWDHRGT